MMFGKQAQYFRKAGGHVVEVGHPLLDLVESKITRQEVYCLLACMTIFCHSRNSVGKSSHEYTVLVLLMFVSLIAK
jgi:lipid A disaccharide synthetase